MLYVMTFVLTWIDLNWYIWYLQFVNLSVSHLSIIQSVGKFNYDTATADYNSAFIWNSKWMICSLMKFLVCSCCTNYCFFCFVVVVVVVVVVFTWLFLLIKGFINLSCIFIVNVLLFCCSMVSFFSSPTRVYFLKTNRLFWICFPWMRIFFLFIWMCGLKLPVSQAKTPRNDRLILYKMSEK